MKSSITALLLIIGFIAGTSMVAAQKEWSFPSTNSNGRATPEYRRNGLHVVANYDYSQRNHKSPWLLIDLALASTKRFVLHQRDIMLITPDGREIPVSSQQQLIDDSTGIRLIVQNSSISRRQLDSYFNQRSTIEPIRFHAVPNGGTVSDEAVVDNDRVTEGAMLFRTPAGSWDAGTYRLEINTEVGAAALPIKLE